MQNKSFKFRLYPTNEQKLFLAQQFGAARFVYNYFLANRKEEYLNNKKSLSYYADAKLLTELKEKDGYKWLNAINSQSLQSSLRNLESAYNNFFRKTAKFPKFHKKSNKQSIKIPQFFSVKHKKLHIPKLKSGISINKYKNIEGKILSCFISKTSADQYYVSFSCEVEIDTLPPSENKIGIDLGLKHIVITSSGDKTDNPKFHAKSEKKLKHQQRQLSKKRKGSNNRNKQRKILAKTYQKITNSKTDFLHKLSHKLINENQVIITENLAVKNMMQNPKLSKAIADANWREFLRQLEYKAKWYGRTFHKIDRFFPSSKTCSNCQYVADNLPLNIREWECHNCNTHHDRDINAAINILNKGLKDLSGSGIESDIKQKLVEASGKKQSRRSKKSLSLS